MPTRLSNSKINIDIYHIKSFKIRCKIDLRNRPTKGTIISIAGIGLVSVNLLTKTTQHTGRHRINLLQLTTLGAIHKFILNRGILKQI